MNKEIGFRTKPRDIKHRLYLSEIQLARQKMTFYIVSQMVMRNGYIMITQKKENHEDYLHTRQYRPQNRIFPEKDSCCVFGGINWCLTSCLIEAKKILELSYQTQSKRSSRALKEKRPQNYSRLEMILLHDNARPHVAVPVKKYLEIFDWKV